MKQLFDDYALLECVGRRNNNKYYRVVCMKCGNIKEVGFGNFNKQDNHHSALNCGMLYYQSMVGKKFGDYIVKEIQHTEDGFIAIMECTICDHTVNCQASQIKSRQHNASTCKNDYYRSMVGMVFGDYIVDSIQSFNGYKTKYNCRCLKCGVISERTTHGITPGVKHGVECIKQIKDSDVKEIVLQRFNNMHNRCNNPRSDNYQYYGGRGIKLMYENAIDMYLDFKDELEAHIAKYGVRNSTFDRIDVNGNYEKSNMRITTQKVQSTNTTRKKIFIIYNGAQRILSDSAMECGRFLNVNGRSIGNVVRGQSKSCAGWKLYRFVSEEENIENVVLEEGVTTNLIVADNQRGAMRKS